MLTLCATQFAGFLKTRASLSPGSGGNLGLMDIILALHWVRDNIASFGGDPKRITVVGHDTGAALANLVLISKSGKGTVDGKVATWRTLERNLG